MIGQFEIGYTKGYEDGKKEIYRLAIKSHNYSVCKFLRGLGDFKDVDIKEDE